MSRKIKFRAWIEKDPYNDDENPEMEMCYDLAFEDYLPINDLLSSVEHLMQYTGLKDRNGTPMYEGDVVTYENPEAFTRDRLTAEVYFNEGSFCMRPTQKDHYSRQVWRSYKNCEVIGNIYENPELLETKSNGDNTEWN